MGTSLSWIAVPVERKELTFSLLDMESITSEEELERRPYVLIGGNGINGWFIIKTQSKSFYSFEKRLPELSRGSELLFSWLHEGTMSSHISCWKDGSQDWAVICQDGAFEALSVEGTPPAVFETLRDSYEREGMFDLPVRLGVALTGFYYARYPSLRGPIDLLVPLPGKEPILDAKWLVKLIEPTLLELGFQNATHDVGMMDPYTLKLRFQSTTRFACWERMDSDGNSVLVDLSPLGAELVYLTAPNVHVKNKRLSDALKEFNSKSNVNCDTSLRIRLDPEDTLTDGWVFDINNHDAMLRQVEAFITQLRDEALPTAERCFNLELDERDIPLMLRSIGGEYHLILSLLLAGNRVLAKEIAEKLTAQRNQSWVSENDKQKYPRKIFLDYVFENY